MKSIFIVILFSTFINAQSIVGKWKTIDDQTGQAKSIVEIYEQNGKFYGKIIDILDIEHKKSICINCSGSNKNKPILGLTIIYSLINENGQYNSGKILDPKNGKLYKCSIDLETKNKLKVRGYIGFSLLGRTQYWYRM